MSTLRPIWLAIRDSVARSFEDDITMRAAALGFYTFLSIFPLLAAMVIVGSYFVDERQIIDATGRALTESLPIGQEQITSTVHGVYQGRGAGSVFSILLLLWAGTRLFSGLRQAVNGVWRIEDERGFVGKQIVRVAMLVVTVLGLVLAVLLSSLLPALVSSPLIQNPTFGGVVWDVLFTVVPDLIIFGVILLLYRFVPACHVGWRTVVPGAIVAAVGFDLAQRIFVWVVGNVTDYSRVYGSFATVVAILVWTYIASIILLYGAELAMAWGRHVARSDDAIQAEDRRLRQQRVQARAQQIEREEEERRKRERGEDSRPVLEKVRDALPKPDGDKPFGPFHGEA